MINLKSSLILLGVIGICVAVLPWLSWLTAYSNGPGLSRSVVVAHRGNGFGYPENTVEGVQAAALNGFRSEIDVRLTQDKEIVVFHDFEINLGACRGAISDLNSSLLAACGVPFLENFSNFTNRHLVGLEIHVKGQSHDLISLVFSHVGPGDVVFVDSADAKREYLQSVSDAGSANPSVRTIFDAKSVRDVDMVEPYMRMGDGIALSTTHLWKDELFTKAFRKSHGVVTSYGGGSLMNDRIIAEGIPLTLYETDFPNDVVTGSGAIPPLQWPYVLFAFPIIITALVMILTLWCLSESTNSRRPYRILNNLVF